MKGNNIFQFNESTMIEAIQFWLNHQFINPNFTVVGIEVTSDSYGKNFDVKISTSDNE